MVTLGELYMYKFIFFHSVNDCCWSLFYWLILIGKEHGNSKKPQFTFHFERTKGHIFIRARYLMLNLAKSFNNRIA